VDNITNSDNLQAPKRTNRKANGLVKCYRDGCERKINREVDAFVTISKKNYHQDCYELHRLRQQHRAELLEYICDLYKISVPNGFILKQIKEFEENYNYKLKGIQMALYYFHDINGNPVNIPNSKYKNVKGIGIVPHIYEEAKQYFIRMQKIESLAQTIKIQTEAEIVRVKPSKKKKPRNFIEIKGLANEQK
jgi:hypothetical protein